jgi:hypothetical protein
MPNGKPAGVPCVNLDQETGLCRIWNTPNYPDVCRNLQAEPEMCGDDREHALHFLAELERITRPPA